MTYLKFNILLRVMACSIGICLVACDGGKPVSSEQSDYNSTGSVKNLIKKECPARSGKNDTEAALLTPESGVGWQIPEENPLVYSGRMALVNGNEVDPSSSTMTVSSGELRSSAARGKIQRTAKFGEWGYTYSDASKNSVFGWGPCIVSGEVIVPDICQTTLYTQRYVGNTFEVEDFGPNHSLIRIVPEKGHRLCVMLGISYFKQGGMEFSGSASKVYSGSKVFGQVTLSEGVLQNVLTAQYPGSSAEILGVPLIQKDGAWHGSP